MPELSGIGSVLRGFSAVYWLLAIGAIALAIWKGKNWWIKVAGALVAIGVFSFLPAQAMVEQAKRDTYAREAWAYFKKKCDTEAGEKIYKTYSGVKSVLVIRPLPPATEKDLYDQFWYGDPYSNATPWDERAEQAATTLTMYSRRPNGRQKGLDFVEIKNQSGQGYTRITSPVSNDKLAAKELIQAPVSRFGIAWDDISTPEDRKYWVAGSRLRVTDLGDNSIVAERVGYLIEPGFGSIAGGRRPWLAARGLGQNGHSCPDAHDYTDQWFITSVFKQDEK
jgi:hypothetical protein